MKPLIFFDCFHTLVYKQGLEEEIQRFFEKKTLQTVSISAVRSAVNALYERRKFTHPSFANADERVRYFIAYNQELADLLGIPINRASAFDLNMVLRHLPYAVYNDVVPVLKYLKNKSYILGVIANWTETLEHVLEETKLRPYLNYVFSSEALKVTKPDPAIFKKVLAEVPEAKDNRVYYIGDDYDLDCRPAKLAGLYPILIDRFSHYPKITEYPKLKLFTELKVFFN